MKDAFDWRVEVESLRAELNSEKSKSARLAQALADEKAITAELIRQRDETLTKLAKAVLEEALSELPACDECIGTFNTVSQTLWKRLPKIIATVKP